MHAYVIGEVAESRSDKFQVGDLIQGEGCWADFFTTKATRVLKLSDHQPTSNLLSVLGIGAAGASRSSRSASLLSFSRATIRSS